MVSRKLIPTTRYFLKFVRHTLENKLNSLIDSAYSDTDNSNKDIISYILKTKPKNTINPTELRKGLREELQSLLIDIEYKLKKKLDDKEIQLNHYFEGELLLTVTNKAPSFLLANEIISTLKGSEIMSLLDEEEKSYFNFKLEQEIESFYTVTPKMMEDLMRSPTRYSNRMNEIDPESLSLINITLPYYITLKEYDSYYDDPAYLKAEYLKLVKSFAGSSFNESQASLEYHAASADQDVNMALLDIQKRSLEYHHSMNRGI